MSIQTIRENQNRSDLDYIWDLIEDGDLYPDVLSKKFKEKKLFKIKGDQIFYDVLDVMTAIQDSNEYENKYYIEGYNTYYDSPLDVPEKLVSFGEIKPVFKKLNT